MKILTAENFDSAISAGTVVVKFGATWCAPCRTMGPLLQKLSDDKGIPVYEVDIDDYPELANRFSVRSVPHVLVFKDGVISGERVGLARPDVLAKMVD